MDELIGKKFGKLTVIEEGSKSSQKVRRWKCQCSCGNMVLVSKFSLTHGLSKSCGCWNREHNLVGKRFGRLIVLEKISERRKNRIYWKCECDCGNEAIIKGNNLTTGTTSSCGCLKKQQEPFNLLGRKNYYSDTEKIEAHKLFLFKRCKKGAYRRGLVFLLDFESFIKIISQPCHYCGSNPLNGIDRVDNNNGYILDNCVPCCGFCNNAKKNLSADKFIEWALKISQNIENKFKLATL